MISTELSDSNFRRFSQLVYENCGINLHDGKKELVRARLGKRLRATGCKNFNTYFKLLNEDAKGWELVHMLDAISTNQTFFFREEKHFEFLKEKVFPSYKALLPKRLRLWSAGCSSGEEPYSLALWLTEHFEQIDSFDVKIMATDISTKVLAKAERGVYPKKQLSKIPKHQLRKYFQRGVGRQEGFLRVKQPLKDMVEFQRHNLMGPFEHENSFHLIFCRNVMIYFKRETRESLIDKFYSCLEVGGYFLIGHAESLTGIKHRFKYVQPSVYKK
ncbi:MAG: protein-glutamate O-methyltransferase CheR [Desulfobacterales bacterium]